MEYPARLIVVAIIVAVLNLGAWQKMVRSEFYADQPLWARWSWTVFYWFLAVGTGPLLLMPNLDRN